MNLSNLHVYAIRTECSRSSNSSLIWSWKLFSNILILPPFKSEKLMLFYILYSNGHVLSSENTLLFIRIVLYESYRSWVSFWYYRCDMKIVVLHLFRDDSVYHAGWHAQINYFITIITLKMHSEFFSREFTRIFK